MSNPFEDLRQAVVVRPMNSPGPQGAAAPLTSKYFMLDENGDIMPKEVA